MNRVGGAMAAAALVVGLGACGRGGSTASLPTVAGAPTGSLTDGAELGAAVEGLCLVRAQARSDVKAARTTFYDRSHDRLHTLARDLEPVDRALAARLLEANEAFEADVNAEPPRPMLAADLDRLVAVATQGLSRLSLPAPRCR